MNFSLDTAQIIACVLVAAATAVLINFSVVFLTRRRGPEKVTIRVIGTAVVAEPGDLLTIALSDQVDDEYYEHLVAQFEPLREMGIKVGVVENAAGVAVARGRTDG